jgi:hypothetical protein
MLKQESQIKIMDKTIEGLKRKLEETNNRKNYRVDIPITKCEFEFIQSENDQPTAIERMKGLVRDISVTGLRFECNDDFSVREKWIIKLFLVFHDKPIEIIGRVTRKDETFGKPLISYGLEFMKTNFTKDEDLFRLVREFEVVKRKKKID